MVSGVGTFSRRSHPGFFPRVTKQGLRRVRGRRLKTQREGEGEGSISAEGSRVSPTVHPDTDCTQYVTRNRRNRRVVPPLSCITNYNVWVSLAGPPLPLHAPNLPEPAGDAEDALPATIHPRSRFRR